MYCTGRAQGKKPDHGPADHVDQIMGALDRRRQQHRTVQRQQRPAQIAALPGHRDIDDGGCGVETGRANQALERTEINHIK